DTGERVRVPVDEALLAAGGEMVVEVVRQRVRAVERGHDPADARPSPACRWCEVADGCGPGRDWLARAGRWRGGLPVLAPGWRAAGTAVPAGVHHRLLPSGRGEQLGPGGCHV